MDFDLEYIEKLAQILNDKNLTEITLENEDKAIVLKKGAEPVVQAMPQVAKPQSIVQNIPPIQDEQKQDSDTRTAIVSPMVGTFYSAQSQDAKPFVKPGDIVKEGQVICIIEAMKLMNEIEAEISGKVSEICVKDGETVEFGQVLMYLE